MTAVAIAIAVGEAPAGYVAVEQVDGAVLTHDHDLGRAAPGVVG